jgi:NAD(P)-dependent dehydrogenase (short-subunit alcohol dehydrogenase family)
MPSRRRIIIGAGVLAAGGFVASRMMREEPPVQRPAGVPLSDFDDSLTAEGVTAGLDLTGKTALVTGANSGMGYETMRVLALRGATVIGTGRTMEKAQRACDSVSGETIPATLELTDFDSVVACADAVRSLDRPIDILVLNAGVMALPELEQVYGLERQFVINHLGHFLLTNLLLDRVVAAPAGRVVVVSSSALKWADETAIEWDNLSGERDYDPKRFYGQSKLANALFSLELSKRLAGTNATSNSMNPGAVLTNLQRHAPEWAVKLGEWIGPAFMKSPAEGATTICYLAAHPRVEGVSGHYFIDCNPVSLGGNSQNAQLASRLWDVSSDLTSDYLAAEVPGAAAV